MTSIREALLAVAGVADATLEEADGEPFGVRVELETGADEREVASSVQSVLSSYGMRSRLAPPRSRLEPVAPPPPPTVLHVRATESGSEESLSPVSEVAVKQRRDLVVVSITDQDGQIAERVARPGVAPVREAVIGAVSQLRNPAGPPPGIVLVDIQESEGSEVLTVVLDLGSGQLRAGAAVVRSGRELALAEATWRALAPPF